MIKKFLIAIPAFVLVALALGAVKAAQIQEMMGMNHAQPVTAVSTAEAKKTVWNPHIDAIASLSPVQGVIISAELEGTVVEILAENGKAVKQGDLLIRLDTMVEEAQLEAAKARAELARLQRDRAEELRNKNTISQAELDSAAAQYAQGVADQAAIQAAINKKAIRAPFDGRVGIREVNLGQYVSRGTPLLPLQKLDQVYVDFYVPQRELPKLAIGQEIQVNVDAFAGRTFTARINAINPMVDAASRNVAVQAILPNPDELLRAGMFAQVSVVLPEKLEVVVVPMTAVAYASYGNSIYVVEQIKAEDGSSFLGVRQQPIELGTKRGDLVAITSGLNGGETVASSGVFKLRNGMPVQINNEVQPSAELNPTPDNT